MVSLLYFKVVKIWHEEADNHYCSEVRVVQQMYACTRMWAHTHINKNFFHSSPSHISSVGHGRDPGLSKAVLRQDLPSGKDPKYGPSDLTLRVFQEVDWPSSEKLTRWFFYFFGITIHEDNILRWEEAVGPLQVNSMSIYLIPSIYLALC